MGRTGAPDTGGVAPTGYVVAGGRGACVGIPRVIFARAGISVPVAKGGGPVLVGVVTAEAEAEPVVVEPTEAEEEAGGAAAGTEADVVVDDAAGGGAEETGGLVAAAAAGAEAEDDADVA